MTKSLNRGISLGIISSNFGSISNSNLQINEKDRISLNNANINMNINNSNKIANRKKINH
jgi:hypothetical protein